jgi:hypothetical protein
MALTGGLFVNFSGHKFAKGGLDTPSCRDCLGSPMPPRPRQTAKLPPKPPAKGKLGGSKTLRARQAKLAWLKGRQADRARWKLERWGSPKGLRQRA